MMGPPAREPARKEKRVPTARPDDGAFDVCLVHALSRLEVLRMMSVWVTIPTAGTWPTPAELEMRNAVIAALTTAGIGSCTGGGEMDFSFRVGEEHTARTAIEATMRDHTPGIAYRLRVSEKQGR